MDILYTLRLEGRPIVFAFQELLHCYYM